MWYAPDSWRLDFMQVILDGLMMNAKSLNPSWKTKRFNQVVKRIKVHSWWTAVEPSFSFTKPQNTNQWS